MKDESDKPRKPWRDPEGSIIKKTEKRRTSSGKLKDETIYYARVRYIDKDGKRREKKRRAASFDDAKTVRVNLREEIKRDLSEKVAPEMPKTFTEIVDYYETEYVKEAEYSGNQKIAGLREPIKYVTRQLNIFRQEFGDVLAGKITYEDIRRFKQKRLAAKVVIEYFEKVPLNEEEKKTASVNKKYNRVRKSKSRPRAVASVNRELERLRRIFNIAVRQGWLEKSPFQSGDSLVSHAAENERVRILSKDEEKRLLDACTGKRQHLRAIIIAALDTCLRKNELFTLTWQDVDTQNRRITVQALNAKTLKKRIVPITKRLLPELEKLKEITFQASENDTVFGIDSSAKKAFYSAMEAAGIEDFRFHDLRGTGITRLLRAGMSPPEVMKISGHTQFKTFLRYVKIDDDTIQRATAALDDYLDK